MIRFLGAAAILAAGCGGAVQTKPPTAAPPKSGDGHGSQADRQAEHGSGHAGGHPSTALARGTLEIAAGARPVAGKPFDIRFVVRRGADRVAKFEVVHEKAVHLIVVRDGLDNFAHLHPSVAADGGGEVRHTFPTGGRYVVFADYKPVGGVPSVAQAALDVEGPVPDAPSAVASPPGDIAADGVVGSVGAFDAPPGKASELSFRLRDQASGAPVNDLQPYLGERGHLVLVREGGDDYVHAHPQPAGDDPSRVAFTATFSKAGLYRGWAEFRRPGRAVTLPFQLLVGGHRHGGGP